MLGAILDLFQWSVHPVVVAVTTIAVSLIFFHRLSRRHDYLTVSSRPQSRDQGAEKDEDNSCLSTPAFEISTTSSQAHNMSIHTSDGTHINTAHFIGGGHAFGNYNTVVNNLTENNELKKTLNLPRAEAGFNDYQTKKKSGPCFEGTRVALLQEMENWVIGSGESRIYVLSGLAGIGKSTVAYTIAKRAANNRINLLGASFFFSRYEADRKNAKRFFTTVAYQLCIYDKSFAKAIGNVLQKEDGFAATTKDPQEQLQALIVEPLQALIHSRAQPILIVVDALDECEEEDALSVLTSLSQLVRALPSFKVILTTRPQPYFDRFFSCQDGHKIFHMQDIEDKVVDGDIRLYLKHCLSLKQVQERFPKWQWYASDEEIDALVLAAGRLFIIASTAARYILDKIASNPATQMRKLLGADRIPFKDLNEFYTIILRSIVPELDCDDDLDIVSRYQSVIGAIIFVQHPLSVTTLACLIDISVEEIRTMLDQLQSVILLGDDDSPRIYHKSFPDYITDSKRCHDVNLRINPRDHQTHITMRCFQIMGQYLRYNILGLSEPAQYMSNEDALMKDGITEKQFQERAPQHLRYACVYWANHLEIAGIDNDNLMKELERFTDRRMLHWFEVLSLIGKFDLASRSVIAAVRVLHTPSDSRKLLWDGLRFIGKFYETIKRSALHTYHSALAFTPTGSPLYRHYINKAICHATGGPEKWNALVANLSHGDQELIEIVQFSLDSTMFASWSENMLKIWDAVTGTPISMIRGNDFAIANDFSTAASWNANTITLHNANGSERGTTITTQVDIVQVAVSPERISAGLLDRTLCLWHSGNGKLVESFDDYNCGRLQFSATGTRLAYKSANGVVKLRNGIDGTFVANLDCGLGDYLCVDLSRDGSRIATMSEPVLKLWSCDGKLVGTAENVGHELTISANGSLLAAEGNKKVKLWSGTGGNPLPLIEVLDFNPCSMAFSPDNTLAIATTRDIKLYNVASRSLISTLSFPYCDSLTFSPDCSRLAAGNGDGTIYLGDIRAVAVHSPSLNKRASNPVTALALSRDCSRLACGFKGGAVELWEISGPTRQRISTHLEHAKKVTELGFSPDGNRFASCSRDQTIKLWEGQDGTLLGTLNHSMSQIYAVEVSNCVVAAVGKNGVVLWDSITLDHIHTFAGNFWTPMSFSANNALLAVVSDATSVQIIVFDVTQRTPIAMFDAPGQNVRAMAFLPDNSQLVAQLDDDSDDSDDSSDDDFNDIDSDNDYGDSGSDDVYDNSDGDDDYDDSDSDNDYDTSDFDDDYGTSDSDNDSDNSINNNILTFNLVNKEAPQRPTFEDTIQLLNLPLWNGVPVGVSRVEGQCCLLALLPQHNDPVNVLQIPREFHVREQVRAMGRSMIALRCKDGRVLLLKPPTTRIA